MRGRLDDVGIGAAILAFGAIVLLVLIPFGVVHPDNIRAGTISPTLWPKATAWLLVTFGFLVALEGVLTASKKRAAENSSDSSHSDAGTGLLRVCLGFILLYASWGAIFSIGLPIASGLIILVFGALFGERRLWLLAVVAVIVPLVLYYFFSEIANVPIPLGSLFE